MDVLGLDTLDVARWQFGITTVYHFLMVPLTLGLGVLVAVMQATIMALRDRQGLVD